jgi:hypothetical protein
MVIAMIGPQPDNMSHSVRDPLSLRDDHGVAESSFNKAAVSGVYATATNPVDGSI